MPTHFLSPHGENLETGGYVTVHQCSSSRYRRLINSPSVHIWQLLTPRPRANAILVCWVIDGSSQWTDTTRALRLTWQARLLVVQIVSWNDVARRVRLADLHAACLGVSWVLCIKHTWTPLTNDSKPFGVLGSRRAVSGSRWISSKHLRAPTRWLRLAIRASGLPHGRDLSEDESVV